jgi:uncharacterized protein (DUF58 family)
LLNPRGYSIDTGKTTQFSEAWLVLTVLLTMAGLAVGSIYLTTAAATMLTVVGLSWLWNRFSLHGVSYDRSLSEIRAFRGEIIDLRLEVRNHKLIPLTWLIVRDIFPPGLPIDEKEIAANPTTNLVDFTTFWMPGAYQRIARTFRVHCIQRGFYRYGPAQVQSGDGFGFFERSVILPGEQRLIVYPRLYSVADLRLPTKTPFGAVRPRRFLYEDPFRTAGVRAWQHGDEQRRIHWKATARQQQLASRVYEPSEEEQVLIFLNVATFRRHWQGVVVELHERAVSVAGSLASLAVEQRLPVGLIANSALPGSDRELRLLPGRRPSQLMHILELLAAVTPFATTPIEELLVREAPRLPWGATLVVVTAIAHDDLLATLLDLSAVGRQIVLFTLAEEPPTRWLDKVTVYHLPHLAADLVAPNLIDVV